MPAAKEPQPRSPAPHIAPVFLWTTPNVADKVFWVERDGDLPENKTYAYGDAFWDKITYPDHKLIHVTPQTPDAWSRWYYAKDRASEDAYNFEFTQADIGGQRFDAVRRTYLVPRADYDPTSPAIGATMPDTPAGLFTGTYLMAGAVEQRTGDELFDSLYVIERRTYVKRTSLRLVRNDKQTGIVSFEKTDLWYTGETVGEGVGTPANATIDSHFAGTATGLFNAATTGQQLSANWFSVTVTSRLPLDGWNESAPTLVWHEFSVAGLGGFKFDALDTLWLMTKAQHTEATNGANVGPGDVFPDASWPFSVVENPADAYILASRKQEWVDAEFDENYVLERRQYFARNQHYDIDFDEETGEHLSTFETLYYRGELARDAVPIETIIATPTDTFWDIDEGVVRIGQTLTENWFLVTSRQVMPAAYADGTTAYRDYYTNINYSWPAVLADVENMTWVMRNRDGSEGSARNYILPRWQHYGYSGPTSVRVQEYWSPTKWDLSSDEPMAMLPTPIHYPSPIMPVSIPACLHPTIVCISDTGTNDPDFMQNTSSAKVFFATNFTQWPDTLVIETSQQPFRSGWRKRVVTATSPPSEYSVIAPVLAPV